jgi:hypothetical protein
MLSCTILLSLSIEYLQHFWPPIASYQPVSHNTQTNKVSYFSSQVSLKQSLQPLTDSDRIKSAIYKKKVDSHSKQKPKP